MIRANDLNRKSWVNIPKNSDFPIQNLPFGVFLTNASLPRVGVALGDYVIDLDALYKLGYLSSLPFEANDFSTKYLNNIMNHGKLAVRELRNRISDLFVIENNELQDNKAHIHEVLYKRNEIEMLLPVNVGDYTDFYSSIEHATNVGKMFRDPENALLPNWKHLPVGYHGRTSSIIPSGKSIHRPKGQTKPANSEIPVFGACNNLDFELEIGFFTFEGKPLGDKITTNEAEDFIFGLVLLNDWSARDIQTWEYVPLGPFLAKNFATSLSPWVVLLDALEPFRVNGPIQDTKVLPYLECSEPKNIDLNLEVFIKTNNGDENLISNSNFKYMYWSMSQQLAHHTINGCNIRGGDLMGSGTISGKEKNSLGSMLELTWKGTDPLVMKDGTNRKFINDGDEVIMRGFCEKNNLRIGFGEVRNLILPAL